MQPMTKLRRNKLKLAKNKIKNTRSKLKNIINWGTYFKHEISINQNGVVSGKMTSFYIYIYKPNHQNSFWCMEKQYFFPCMTALQPFVFHDFNLTLTTFFSLPYLSKCQTTHNFPLLHVYYVISKKICYDPMKLLQNWCKEDTLNMLGPRVQPW
jgi:hypothetical protein